MSNLRNQLVYQYLQEISNALELVWEMVYTRRREDSRCHWPAPGIIQRRQQEQKILYDLGSAEDIIKHASDDFVLSNTATIRKTITDARQFSKSV